MEETKKYTSKISEICSKIVTDLINETNSPQEALSILTKAIYCVIKFAEIEVDDELENTFKTIFSKEYIKERIEKIEIHSEVKEEQQ